MAKQFMFSAFTTVEGRDSGDYSKDYLWANGGTWNGSPYGYAAFSHNGTALYGPLVAQEYPTPTRVKATYMAQDGSPFVLEVDSAAKAAVITQGDVIIHDQLYPPYPSYLSLTDDSAQAQAA